MRFHILPALLSLILGLQSSALSAAVSPEAARELTQHLTPVGAERAGNPDGAIPPWTGGYTTVIPGYVDGQIRPDPFAAEHPSFTITADNIEQFRDKLPDGQIALFKKYPDYRMEVYPSHRTAAAPASVYDAVFANATQAKAAPEGITYGIENAVGGIPFPIPQSGAEIVWNHLLAFWGPARSDFVATYFISESGEREVTNQYQETVDFPYYYPSATRQSVGEFYFERKEISNGPPDLAGRGYISRQPLNIARNHVQTWQYLPGERRVRKAPALAYDTPTPDGGGVLSFDDYYIFSGSPDRYQFVTLGKKEMYIPYNNNRFHATDIDAVTGPQHENPASMRYELHRVWVVDAMLAPGKQDLVPHRRLYFDEDTWLAVYGESWDADRRLWKFSHATMYLVPDLPAVVQGSEFVYDLENGGYVLASAFNGKAEQFKLTPPHDDTVFAPESLSADGVR